MTSEIEIKSCLESMAARLDTWLFPYAGVANGTGWGQFIDGPRQNTQVGPYGTCAGVIVRSLAGRPHIGADRNAINVLHDYLRRIRENEPEAHRLFAQNLRLAFLALALRLAGPNSDECLEAEGLLVARILATGNWGDWWIDGERHDSTPRPFVTAVSILCLTILRAGPLPANLQPIVRRATAWLHQSVRGNPDLSLLTKAAALAAVAHSTIAPDRATGAEISSLALAPVEVTSDVGVYFFDYQYLANTQVAHWRDYFIVPIELLTAISALSGSAGPLARVRVQKTIELVKRTVMDNQGAYRSNSQQRFSTKNQAWAAVVLACADRRIATVKGPQKVAWWFIRPRQNRFFDSWFPPIALVATTGLAVFFPDDQSWSGVLKALGPLIVGGLYAPESIRYLLKGRT